MFTAQFVPGSLRGDPESEAPANRLATQAESHQMISYNQNDSETGNYLTEGRIAGMSGWVVG